MRPRGGFIPAYTLVLNGDNGSTGNGQIPGYSFMISVVQTERDVGAFSLGNLNVIYQCRELFHGRLTIPVKEYRSRITGQIKNSSE